MSLKITIQLDSTNELAGLTAALEIFLECTGEQYKEETKHVLYPEAIAMWEQLEGARRLYERVSGTKHYKAFDKPTRR